MAARKCVQVLGEREASEADAPAAEAAITQLGFGVDGGKAAAGAQPPREQCQYGSTRYGPIEGACSPAIGERTGQIATNVTAELWRAQAGGDQETREREECDEQGGDQQRDAKSGERLRGRRVPVLQSQRRTECHER
eukprot:SAG31_NODE_1438_length_8338_cov_18.446413_6_plen_137_part_00